MEEKITLTVPHFPDQGTDRVFVEPNSDPVEIVLPYSEVCMHMRVAGRKAFVKLQTPNGRKHPVSAQLFMKDMTPFSSPITFGEAGFYFDRNRIYYYPPHPQNTTAWIGEEVKKFFVTYHVGESTYYLTRPQMWQGTTDFSIATPFNNLVEGLQALCAFMTSALFPTSSVEGVRVERLTRE